MYDPNETSASKTASTAAETVTMATGNRAKSKERNRLKILESAATLFRERGFEAATLRDIARAAGLSTGALFANFADKNEIFMTVLEEENAKVIGAMRSAHDESLPLVVRLHRQLMRAYETSQHNARIVLSAFVMKWSHDQSTPNEVGKMSEQVRVVLLNTLTQARERKEIPAGADIDCASEVLEDLCFANLRRAYQASDDAGGYDLNKMAENLTAQIRIVIAGISA
ncbi:TetR/AcrR family transcriptional regulator [Asticcacaulis sp. 201]|uniref:TetR/AcrR family transcriptional regulator n=1 Tax=Asticcacaulis sp. 201 TaxID=3028787 RepID=UPI002916338F|nr:TetR/AcrR family transcriptional regulator [Asticcacaulis sp. 201]MDV6331759.1 TetR/AcrR family transcriptional regulator [Asticcacaulis sp. 201]